MTETSESRLGRFSSRVRKSQHEKKSESGSTRHYRPRREYEKNRLVIRTLLVKRSSANQLSSIRRVPLQWNHRLFVLKIVFVDEPINQVS